jgi:hypothetical protein
MRNDTPTLISMEGLADEAFLQKAYLLLLGRPADPTGFRDYLEALREGVPREQIWEQLAASEEARSFHQRAGVPAAEGAGADESDGEGEPDAVPARSGTFDRLMAREGSEFVKAAYLAVLGREADRTGHAYYKERLRTGHSKAAVLAELAASPEASRATGEAVLEELAARAPRMSGKVAHVNDLTNLAGVAFVRDAYRAVLGREADLEGMLRYLDVLQSGMSRSFVLQELANSPEAREKRVTLPGLAGFVDAYRKAQSRSLAGWYWREVRGAESDLPAARELRNLAHELRRRSASLG